MRSFIYEGPGKTLGKQRGFTLGELITVICILSLVLLMAIPSLHAFAKVAHCKKGVRDLVGAIRFARSRAITTGYEHRVEIDPKNRCYRLTRGNRFSNSTDSSWGANVVADWQFLPEKVSLRVNAGCQQSNDTIYFHANPTGSTNSRYICILDEKDNFQFRLGIPQARTGRVKIEKWNGVMNSWK